MVKPEGKILKFSGVEEIDPDILETFHSTEPALKLQDLPEQWVKYETAEFSAVCPFSGLPDIGTVIVEYIPATKILELKSLKYYLLTYRQVGIYQEHATQKIYADLKKILQPKRLVITTIYNTRGGINTTCKLDSLNPV